MNNLIIILIIICVTIVLGKWVLLIFLSPLLRIKCRKERKAAALLQIEDDKLVSMRPDGLPKATDELPPSPPSRGKHLKMILYGYIDGLQRYLIIQTGFIPSHHLRDFIYRNVFLVRMEKGAVIYYGAEIRGPQNLSLHRGAIVGDRNVIDARRGYVEIEEDVQLGNFVNLWTGSHDHDDPWFRSMPGKRGPIRIGKHAWIGPSVTILHSVTIGEGAVVGAGSVVTKDVEPFSIVAGVPAKKIAMRSQDLRYRLGENHVPFY